MTKDELLYWRIVRQCMIDFFAIDHADALRRVAYYRRRLREAGPSVYEFSFHDEPLNTAGNLTGVFSYNADLLDRYDSLLKREGVY